MICFKQIKYTTLENKRSKVLAKNIWQEEMFKLDRSLKQPKSNCEK